MSRRFQFSLKGLLVAVAWLAVAATASERTGHYDGLKFNPEVPALTGVMLAGLGGALGAVFGKRPIIHSFVGAFTGALLQALIVALGVLFTG